VSAKIYTKKGDKGASSTIKRVGIPKYEAVFEVLGTIDELNATLGLLHQSKKIKLKKEITALQRDLFEFGALFAKETPGNDVVHFFVKKTEGLEHKIDVIDDKNIRLTNFILPGRTKEAGYLHLARTVCRRLGRVLTLYLDKAGKKGFDEALAYTNRLSDYLFVLARFHNKRGKADVKWISVK